jgi:UDP-3-O-[3-hydroxymyristoyl] N-acetylglucosamine deacetylase
VRRERKTLQQTCLFEGVGLHSGVPVKMRVHPSEDGINFRLNGERVRAIPCNVTDTKRSTKLGSIATVEHLMSAFCGLEITDAEVELTDHELPGLDGSSHEYAVKLRACGLQDLPPDEMPEVFQRVFFQEGNVKVAIGKGNGSWRFEFDTGMRWPGVQSWGSDDVVANYLDEISTSRTIAFSEEVPYLLQAGFGQGLDAESVLILGESGYENQPRFQDEPVRHKLLDLLGDLYLSGVPARHLSVVAERSGHRANVRAAALLVESLS